MQDRITVQCCDRAYGEDDSGDSRYPPATLIYHRSGIAALKATLEHKHIAALDDIKNAASRVEKLKMYVGACSKCLITFYVVPGSALCHPCEFGAYCVGGQDFPHNRKYVKELG
jgi:hypothetical protein